MEKCIREGIKPSPKGVKMKLYIAYGSNTNRISMAVRCPDAKYIGKSKLENYKLAFKGTENYSYLTVIPDENSTLDVMIWAVSDSDETALDRYEDCPELYSKKYIPVNINGEPVNALIYIMNNGFEKALPSEEYFNEVLDGYIENGLETEPLFQAMFDTKTI